MTLPRDLPGRYGRVIQDLERMLVATEQPALVAGGWAVWHHGYVGRITQDVDIVVSAIGSIEFLKCAPMFGFQVLTAPAGRWPKLIHQQSQIEVDFLPEAEFPGTPSHRAPIPIGHPMDYAAKVGCLTFIDIAPLFELKIGAHRAKDIADLIELVKANGSKLEEIAQYLSQKHPSYAEQFAELRRQAKEETSF